MADFPITSHLPGQSPAYAWFLSWVAGFWWFSFHSWGGGIWTHEMTESKSVALPLGYTPKILETKSGVQLANSRNYTAITRIQSGLQRWFSSVLTPSQRFLIRCSDTNTMPYPVVDQVMTGFSPVVSLYLALFSSWLLILAYRLCY